MAERCVCCGEIIPEGQQVCPGCKKGKGKMANEKRLIDANALKDFVCSICNALYGDEPCKSADCRSMDVIDEMPTVDAVEVIRCKDCVRHSSNGCPDDRVWCRLLCRYMDADGFCSRGERSEGE